MIEKYRDDDQTCESLDFKMHGISVLLSNKLKKQSTRRKIVEIEGERQW